MKNTLISLNLEEQIYLDFMPRSHGKALQISGEIIRKSDCGMEVEIRIIFKYQGSLPKLLLPATRNLRLAA